MYSACCFGEAKTWSRRESPGRAAAGNRAGFRSDRFLRRTHPAFGLDVIAQHGTPAGVSHRFDFCENGLAIPDIFRQACVDIVHERLQFGHFMARFFGRWFSVFTIPSDGALRATHLSCNCDTVQPMLSHVLYHVKVLYCSACRCPFWCESLKETTCWVERTNQMVNSLRPPQAANNPGAGNAEPVYACLGDLL